MSQVETDQHHLTLVAALHARTYRESIERLARYKQLCSAEEFRSTPQGDELVVEVSWPKVHGGRIAEKFMREVEQTD